MNPPNEQQLSERLQTAWKMHQSGQLKAAESAYQQLISDAPSHPDLNNLLGLLYIQTRRPKLAARHITTALKTEPGNPQSLYNLGIAYKDLEQWDKAASAFERAVQASPNNPDAVTALANSLKLAGRIADSGPWFEQVVKLKPDSAETWNDLGVARNKLGDPDGALKAYARATELNSDFARAWLNRGIVLEQAGDLETAADAYQQAIRSDARFADAHFYLAHLRSHQSTTAEIEAMESLISEPKLGNDKKLHLAFGLGMALDSRGEYARAFDYMQQGHAIQAGGTRFSIDPERSRFDRVRSVYSADFINSHAGSASADARPILVSGMPRSGTTLAEQILASHPEVVGRGESMAISQAAWRLSGGQFPDGALRTTPEQFRSEGDRYVNQLCGDAGAALRVTDTTPMNFQFTGLAATMLPGARFIHCTRNAMDNCLSLYRQLLTGPLGFEHNLSDLGAYYRLQAELLAHWQAALGDRLFVLEYEQLVQEPEQVVPALLEFCGLEFDPVCLDFHQTGRRVMSPSAGQVRQPLYTSSIGAWKHYENQLQPLVKALSG